MTAQVPEILELRGRELSLCAEPLEPFLSRLAEDSRPKFVWMSTACWRGYVGRWSITSGMLFLTGLQARINTPEGVVTRALAEVFPEFHPQAAATWFTGELRRVEGRLLHYMHAGFGSTYERDRFFDVCAGKIVGEWAQLNRRKPLLYRIDPSGRRIRVDRRGPDAAELADPLSDQDWSAIERASDEKGGYLVAAAYVRGTRSAKEGK